MMMRLVLLAALLGLAAAGKADRQEAFYQTYMRNLASNGRSSVSIANGYPDNSISTSLTQSQISQCRVLGCPYCEQEDIPWGAHFQTDFTCNPDLHHEERYSYEHEHKMNMVGVASDKVGVCEWDFSIYRWRQDFIPGDILPVFDTTSIKLGSATGTCYFNSDVDKCDGPFCGSMSITVQGGIYIALTYSEYPTNILSAPLGDTCNPLSGLVFNREMLMRPVDKSSNNFTRRGDGPLSDALMEAIKRTPIWEKAQQIAGESSAGRAQAADASASVAASYGRREDEPLYAGLSLIITGPASISSMKHLKVEETGHLEYVPLFLAFTDSATGKYDFPYVRGGALKVNFREEERSYHH